jgi:hypothetical protein
MDDEIEFLARQSSLELEGEYPSEEEMERMFIDYVNEMFWLALHDPDNLPSEFCF